MDDRFNHLVARTAHETDLGPGGTMTTSAALGRDDLVLTSSTLGNPPFAELVAAASAAGFAGLSLWPAADHAAALASGLTDADLRRMLDDTGLVVHDVDCIVQWVGDGDRGGPYFEEPPRHVLWRTAEALGARYVNVLLIGKRAATEDDAAEALAAVCDEAAEHGVVATVEFAAGTKAPDLAAAARIVDAAGRPNASLLLDAWHLHWAGTDVAEVAAAPTGLIRAVQLCDAPAEEPEDLAHATRYARLVPGAGASDLVGLVRALDASGYEGPLSVEVFDQPLVDEIGVEAMARRAADGARAVAAAARAQV